MLKKHDDKIWVVKRQRHDESAEKYRTTEQSFATDFWAALERADDYIDVRGATLQPVLFNALIIQSSDKQRVTIDQQPLYERR